MPRRRYGQFCPLAKALDVLGERWTLLVVRELLAGPKRYTDLRAGLPGLATDLLATRLRELQEAGVIGRREVPPPTPATVYELTERGQALRPVIRELSHWGRPLLREPADDRLSDSALLLGLEVAFHPDAAVGLDQTFDIEVDGRPVVVRVHDGTVDVTPGSAGQDASFKIVTDRQGFIDLARGRAGDRVHVEGDTDALARLQRAFSLTWGTLGATSLTLVPSVTASNDAGLLAGRLEYGLTMPSQRAASLSTHLANRGATHIALIETPARRCGLP